jgi:glutamyl/glutaminyl-tRNA synthetase
LWKKDPSKESAKNNITGVIKLLESVDPSVFDAQTVKNTIWDFAEKQGRGDVLWPTRYALSGKEKSPDPFTLASILGKKETLQRLQHAVRLLSDT